MALVFWKSAPLVSIVRPETLVQVGVSGDRDAQCFGGETLETGG